MAKGPLGITEFGGALLRTGDLDPVYVALYNSGLDSATLSRLCLAYWCFYHLGAAATLAEIKSPKKYWEKMMEAAINAGEPKPWPRGAERRHFRGQQSIDAMKELVLKYKTPEHAVEGMLGVGGSTTYGSVATAAKSHRGFGDWIAFKIADMAERVLGYAVDFSDCHLGIYKDPRQGAALAFHTGGDGVVAGEPWKLPITDEQLREGVAYYVKHFRSYECMPAHVPGGWRKVNVQEVETIFCKWKSHVKGHYPVGKDTEEISHGLVEWERRSDLARQLNQGLNSTRDAVMRWRKKHERD